MDQVSLNDLEDFEMNFDREILSNSKTISNVILFSAVNWLDDISNFTQREGSKWDNIVITLFKEFWRFIADICVHNGQGLTEDDYSNKIKNIMIDIENLHSPDKVTKSKIKSLIQNKLYQSFLLNLRKLHTTPEPATYRLVVHGVIQEIQGKYFQQVYKGEFGLRKRIYDPEYSEIMENLVQTNNDNLKALISIFKNEFYLFFKVIYCLT